uniref:Rho termination factor-like N-terminal domain-containing protein n=2 Tax=Lepeophtheirus salmonis TaxID=72036 RepID=A0A0K2TIJ4_LEPSM
MEMVAIVGSDDEGFVPTTRKTYFNYIGEWEDLSILSLNQLRSIAKDLGIPSSSSLRKESVIQALKAHHAMDWKALKEILPDSIHHRKKIGSRSHFKNRRFSRDSLKKSLPEDNLNMILKDIPLLSDINIPEIFSDNFKRLTSTPAIPDLTGIKSVVLKKRPFIEPQSQFDKYLDTSQKNFSKMKSKFTPKTSHQNLGVIPDYYMPSRLQAFQCRRAETYVTYTSLNPISSIGDGFSNEFQFFQS